MIFFNPLGVHQIIPEINADLKITQKISPSIQNSDLSAVASVKKSKYRSFDTLYRSPSFNSIIRPAEFDEIESMLVAMVESDSILINMWGELIEIYSQEGVTMIVTDPRTKPLIQDEFNRRDIPSDAYNFLNYPVNSMWIRDYGPEFVIELDGTRHIIDNYYTGPKGNQSQDDSIPLKIGTDNWIHSDGSRMRVHRHETSIAGGNLMTDGEGTCICSSTIYTNENPKKLPKKKIDQLMLEYFGCRQLITLEPLCLESTGHIDMFAKIVSPTTILLGEFSIDTHFDGNKYSETEGFCENDFPNDYEVLEKNYLTLASTNKLDGRQWNIIRVPMLEPYLNNENEWVYRSYLNSQIFNGSVAVPVYRIPRKKESVQILSMQESKAIRAYEKVFGKGHVNAIRADHIIEYGGAIHCISHEIPAGH